MFIYIITFGFLLAMRGARPASLQDPFVGLKRLWRETADFWLTLSLLLALLDFVASFEEIRMMTQNFEILNAGLAAFLLSRYQKKSDVFFFTVLAGIFMVRSEQPDLPQAFAMACVMSVGTAFFQTFFLGLRHRLLFSRVPDAMKGWPVLCLLAAFISIIFSGVSGLVF
jgi:hypothetical protein